MAEPAASGEEVAAVIAVQVPDSCKEYFDTEYKMLDTRSNNIQTKLKKRMEDARVGILDYKSDTKTNIENRLLENDKALRIALENGQNLITNIKATARIRFVDHRRNEEACTEDVMELMRRKDLECKAKMEVIEARLVELHASENDSIRLSELLGRQKTRIAALLKEKDDVIEKLRDEFDRMSNSYQDNSYRHNTDSFCLIDRMVAHLELMRSLYNHQLNLLYDTVDDERETLRIGANRRWDKFAERIHENMEQKDKMEREKRQFYTEQLERIKLEHTELTRAARIRLETDQQQLLVEMREMKAKCLLKSEMFDYNIQILQKKGDENVLARNQEKRLLAQLRQKEIGLRKSIDHAKSSFKTTSAKLTTEIERFHDSLMELETRAQRGANISYSKFKSIWNMNKIEAKNLLQKVLSIDKVLFEQQLGIEWPKPVLQEMEETELPSYIEALKTLKIDKIENVSTVTTTATVRSAHSGGSQKVKWEQQSVPVRSLQQQMLADTRVVRSILRQLAAESGFLIEAKLNDLLRPYLPAQKTIVLLDNVFCALGIDDMKGASTLMEYFVPYAYCKNCNVGGTAAGRTSTLLDSESENSVSMYRRDTMSANPFSTMSTVTVDRRPTAVAIDHDLISYMSSVERIDRKEIARQSAFTFHVEESPKAAHAQCVDHEIVIEPGNVLVALRQYTASCLNRLPTNPQTTPASTMFERLDRKRPTISRLLSADDISKYWTRFRQVFTGDPLWASLESGLKIYLKILQRRDKLDTECEHLRRQNVELNHMLQPFMRK